MAKERRGEPESTSPGPHGMFKTTTGVHSKERKAKVPGFAKEMAASGKKKERTNGRKEKAEKLTRLMKKGYRKGYRVGEEPGGMSREPLSRPNPFTKRGSKRGSSRKSGR